MGAVIVRSRCVGPGRRRAWLLLVVSSLALVLGVGGASGNPHPGGRSAEWPVVADFNRDGRPDLAVLTGTAGDGTYQLSVLLGDGNGGFRNAPGSPFTVGQTAAGFAVGDFNEDGRPDIVVGNSLGKAVLLLGSRRGRFQRAGWSPFTMPNVGAVGVGDFNGDGHLDLVVSSQNAQGQTLIHTLPGDGQGHFTNGPTTLVSVPDNSQEFGANDSLVPGDFNADGYLDLAYAYGPDISCMSCSPGPYPHGALDVMLGDGHGGFHEAPGSPYPGGINVEAGYDAYNPVVADFNGDGYSDIAQDDYNWTTGSGTARVLLGGPTGQLKSAPGSPFAIPFPGSLATGDVNGDGHLDLVSANPDPRAHGKPGYAVLLGDGTGGFRDARGSPWPLSLCQDAGSALADFNHDGRTDLVVADRGCGNAAPGGLRILLSGPLVALTVPARIRAGAPVRLSVTAVRRREFMGAAITDYRWDLGSGHFTIDSHTTPSIRVTFHRAGLHKVRLKVTDSAGHTTTRTKRLHVLPRRTGQHRS